MSDLTAKQVEVLCSIGKGEKPYAIWRQTLKALLRRGLISRTNAGYQVTENGITEINQMDKTGGAA